MRQQISTAGLPAIHAERRIRENYLGRPQHRPGFSGRLLKLQDRPSSASRMPGQPRYAIPLKTPYVFRQSITEGSARGILRSLYSAHGRKRGCVPVAASTVLRVSDAWMRLVAPPRSAAALPRSVFVSALRHHTTGQPATCPRTPKRSGRRPAVSTPRRPDTSAGRCSGPDP